MPVFKTGAFNRSATSPGARRRPRGALAGRAWYGTRSGVVAGGGARPFLDKNDTAPVGRRRGRMSDRGANDRRPEGRCCSRRAGRARVVELGKTSCSRARRHETVRANGPEGSWGSCPRCPPGGPGGLWPWPIGRVPLPLRLRAAGRLGLRGCCRGRGVSRPDRSSRSGASPRILCRCRRRSTPGTAGGRARPA